MTSLKLVTVQTSKVSPQTKFQIQNECSFIAEEKFIACQRKNSQQSFPIYQNFVSSVICLNSILYHPATDLWTDPQLLVA